MAHISVLGCHESPMLTATHWHAGHARRETKMAIPRSIEKGFKNAKRNSKRFATSKWKKML